MNRHNRFFAVATLVGLSQTVLAHAQITTTEGAGVLNAPYRGTINTLREQSMNIPYGEVQAWVEPIISTLPMTSSTLDVWRVGDWDRSVLRLYEGVDAWDDEVNLDTHDASNKLTLTRDGGSFKRLSLKAIGTRTLEPVTFTIRFSYRLDNVPVEVEREFTVAPVTGSFFSLLGDSEAFLLGTPILDISVGAASLTIPIGQTTEMIGAAFEDKDRQLGPSNMSSIDIVFPGAAESVFIQNFSQFRLNHSSWAKGKYGTPWPGHLIGFYNSGDTWVRMGSILIPSSVRL